MGNRSSTPTPTCESWTCGKPDCGHGERTKIDLHFLLIGRTGDGKSATGNFILGKKDKFETSGGGSSKTKEVQVAWAKSCCFDIKIIDSPGLQDTDLSRTDDVKQAVKNMAKALLLCNGGVHAFLLVIQFGVRFTLEMKETISDLKKIFGEDYLKMRGIIIVTCGDRFAKTMKNDGSPGLTFEEWSRKQGGEFKILFRECSSRILLFDNFTKDEKVSEAQRNKLFALAVELGKSGIYTSKHFKMYREIRQKLEEMNGPLFKEDLQRSVNLLIDGIPDLLKSPTLQDVDCLEAVIKDLLLDVRRTDDVGGTLRDIKKHLTTTGPHIDELKLAIEGSDAVKVKSHVDAISDQVEGLKKAAKIPWGKRIIHFFKEIGRRDKNVPHSAHQCEPDEVPFILSDMHAAYL